MTNANGSSAATTVNLQPALPGFFRLTEEYVLATGSNGAYIGPSTPAKALDTITLWGTGFGPTNPEVESGAIFNRSSPVLNPVTIRIGQATAQVPYAGMTGAGLYQFSVVVPALPAGDYPVVAEVAGVRSASIARLRIGS